MDETKYKELFKKIIRKKHGMEIDFERIEIRLQHLRKGDALKYSDLENIADDNCWPFNKYWMWPSKEQIEEKLKSTTGWFKDLPKNEEEIIGNLCGIFKNIALVSIILRFLWPKHYVIYSRPPLKILRTERGSNDLEEYLNYVQEMKLFRKTFGVAKTADVDMIVWAIAQAAQYNKAYLKEFNHLIAERLPGNLLPADLIECLSKRPLKIAGVFMKKDDYKTAGMWTARAFEQFLYEECRRLMGFVPPIEKDRIYTLTKYLCERPQHRYNKNIFKNLRKLRVKAVHVEEIFTKQDAKKFIKIIQNLAHKGSKN